MRTILKPFCSYRGAILLASASVYVWHVCKVGIGVLLVDSLVPRWLLLVTRVRCGCCIRIRIPRKLQQRLFKIRRWCIGCLFHCSYHCHHRCQVATLLLGSSSTFHHPNWHQTLDWLRLPAGDNAAFAGWCCLACFQNHGRRGITSSQIQGGDG